jgi:hypothetical protein
MWTEKHYYAEKFVLLICLHNLSNSFAYVPDTKHICEQPWACTLCEVFIRVLRLQIHAGK